MDTDSTAFGSLIWIAETLFFSSVTGAILQDCSECEKSLNSTIIIKCFVSARHCSDSNNTKKTDWKSHRMVFIFIGACIYISLDNVTSHKICSGVFLFTFIINNF